ncbi:ABC transporter substrate-binding protein, partial [bacterium]|nr:ABC transporter substrate-binding protein [bacterium]
LSAARLAAARPDVALLWGYQRGAAEQVERLGIPAVRLRARSAEEAVALVASVAEACGAGEAGRSLVRRLRSELAELDASMPRKDAAARPLVYLELHSPFKCCGPGSYGHDLIVRAGGRNLAADAPVPYPVLSNEAILAAQPDLVVLVRAAGTPGGDLAARPGWASLRAVRAGRVHVVPSRLLSPGPRVAEAVGTLRRLFYPAQEH